MEKGGEEVVLMDLDQDESENERLDNSLSLRMETSVNEEEISVVFVETPETVKLPATSDPSQEESHKKGKTPTSRKKGDNIGLEGSTPGKAKGRQDDSPRKTQGSTPDASTPSKDDSTSTPPRKTQGSTPDASTSKNKTGEKTKKVVSSPVKKKASPRNAKGAKKGSYDIAFKNKVLDSIEFEGMSVLMAHQKYNIPKSTVHEWKRYRAGIRNKREEGFSPSTKRVRAPKHPHLDVALLEWFKDVKELERSVPLNNEMIATQASR